MTEWCSTSSAKYCAAGTALQFKITSGFKNPDFILDSLTDSFEIDTVTPDGLYYYDVIRSSVFLSPTLLPN